MIGKVPDQGKSFRGVVNYLLFGKKDEPSPERVAWVETRNLLVTDPKKAATLMRLTAQKSKRVKTPVYHYVISWRHDEAPTDDIMRIVADTTCQDLGLDEHQMLYVAHRDTDHRHVHIVANRVHPDTGRAWKNSHDYRRIECSLRRQAEGMGMDYVPGRHNDPERFHGKSRAPANPERQRNRRLKQRDLPRFDEATRSKHRERLHQLVLGASSWADLDSQLASEGFAVLRKGQGLVLADASGTMKLSDLGRDIRLKGLEERFAGSFADHEEERKQQQAMQKALVPSRPKTVERQPEPPADKPAEVPPPGPKPKEPNQSAERFEALKDAGDKADMTYSLYNMGLASREQVKNAARELKQAREKLDEGRPLIEQLTRDMFKEKELEPEPRAEPSRQRRRDRGRGR
ncbi:Relaxase/mobilization nuclease family protein [Rhodomicrobium vannielii ATCC 17100]|uniref:Relaxase/mobilization nuclease family protein n=1 Tax=Rhodomicrobium vannielii (strain ATCC 17100 / DSM 162 / LMG 4299 / NCIMB 10020 / ATH 3.1.1) TaxID=648757 RepID=E3I6L9_RHOVT|nr:relaxase/mobilization nuclease domain-containing protein [Rhodomicrobium vannielii]ADP70666.1 Relaxase/mobilization nuclease family protein [Rhodomicrobium vannielii ATCC 17100]